MNEDGPNSENASSSPKKMKIVPPIHRLPNELLVKIIDEIPLTQWPPLELIDPKFRDAVFLAWESVRAVDIDRDFLYSDTKEAVKPDETDSQMAIARLRCQIARKTEVVLKKLIERSPLITSLSGVSLMAEDSSWNTAVVQCLLEFECLEMIKFTKNRFVVQIGTGSKSSIVGGIHIVNLIEFIESTQSRATLKEISIERCYVPDGPVALSHFDRLRAAFSNVSNDPMRQFLRLESFSIGDVIHRFKRPITFIDTIDTSRMTTLSFGNSEIEPVVLTTLINGAPQLRHIDFAFLQLCTYWSPTPCQSSRSQANKELLAALGSRSNLRSLEFGLIGEPEHASCACHRFKAEFMRMLATIGPQLEKFAFDFDSLRSCIRLSEICYMIRNRMTQLKSLKIRGIYLDPMDLRDIADLRELEEIELDINFDDDDENAIDVLSTMLKNSPRLKRFAVDSCKSANQRVVAELCKLHDLIELLIRRNSLTAENFVAFSRVFAVKLRVLRLGWINEGAEPGLIEFVSKAKQLRVLMVDQNVTDQLLKCVAVSCPYLETFSATSNGNTLTLAGVQMLVDGCPKLRQLDVENKDRTLKESLVNLKFDRYRNPPFLRLN